MLWSWLQLPVAGGYWRAFDRISIWLCLALVLYGLVRETEWQNAIRGAMGMPPVAAGLPVVIAIVSVPVAVFLIFSSASLSSSSLWQCSFRLVWQSSSLPVSRFSAVSALRRRYSGRSAVACC